MKDAQGANIVNPETMKIIRNLRQKAIHENRDREYYINQILDYYTPMQIFEEHAQGWCLKNNIVGYDYIVNAGVKTKKDKEA